jgi:hypothetical protein
MIVGRNKKRFGMKKRIIILSGLLGVMVSLAAPSANAADPKELGTFGKWSAYVFTEDGNKVCYMASEPDKHEGNYTRRDKIYALVTHRPAEGTKNVFSYITGYPYKAGSDATVKVGSRTYTLFTQDETAWAPDAATDNQVIESIRKGSTMVVRGVSKRGTQTTDTFSLSGSAAAHDAISRECGI